MIVAILDTPFANPRVDTRLSVVELSLQDLVFKPSIVAKLNELSARDGIEFVWGTSWFDYANTILAPAIGLNAGWQHLGDEEQIDIKVRDSFNWKHDLVRDFIASREEVEHFFWFDDDLVTIENKPEWSIHGGQEALDWAATIPNLTAIGTNPDEGLTMGMLDMVERALRSN
jgi:hypothetical protein